MVQVSAHKNRAAHPGAPHRRRPRGQQGATLIEVLIALGVMMPLSLAGAMGMLTAVQASDGAQQRQELEVALSSGTELVRVVDYLPCGTTEQYQAALSASRPAATDRSLVGAQEAAPVVTAIAYWDSSSGTYGDRCVDDQGAQRFTIAVIDRGVTSEATTVKRTPSETAGGPR